MPCSYYRTIRSGRTAPGTANVTGTAVAFCSFATAPAAIAAWRPDALVSAFSPRRRIAAVDDRPHLRLAFHDVEQPRLGRSPPTAAQIGAFVDFVEQAKSARLLIHCRAGISRSPALAIIAAIVRGERPETIFGRLAPFAALLRPNRLLLALADRRLGLGGTLAVQASAAFAAAYGALQGAELSAVVELVD
jgi:predicted protein tyrosine phosphatase